MLRCVYWYSFVMQQSTGTYATVFINAYSFRYLEATDTSMYVYGALINVLQ